MDSSNEITHDFSPYFRVHKDGCIERLRPTVFLPPSDDPNLSVRSKDVVISPETGVSIRLFLPKIADPTHKLPLFVHIHGGAFCVGSPSNPVFHNFISSLVEKANVVAASIDYRLAPEHPLPIAYDDSWTALQWVLSHANGNGPESWLNHHADFSRVFIGGESAGANIANHIAIQAGITEIHGVKIVGLLLVHPFFGGKDEADEMYKFMCPTSSGGNDDLRLNPAIDPRLPRMAGNRVLFCLAENDRLRERGWSYYEALRQSGWVGEVEITETEGVGHGFHLLDPTCEKAAALVNRLASFLSED